MNNVDLRGQLILKAEQIQDLKKEVRHLNDQLANVTGDSVKKDNRISKLTGDVEKYKDVLQMILKANEGKIKFPKESDISMLPLEITDLIVSLISQIYNSFDKINTSLLSKRMLGCYNTSWRMFICKLLSISNTKLFELLRSLKNLS